VLAFDTTNFDTHIATTTPGEPARRGHAKSKRSDLRVVGLAALVSETGHVPLLHRTYPGNGSDQTVLGECLKALGKLHDALDDAEERTRPACRTLVRDGGSWSEQLELDLDVAGYYTLISLPLSHSASQLALEQAARRGAMKSLGGKLEEVRAARLRTPVGELLDRQITPTIGPSGRVRLLSSLPDPRGTHSPESPCRAAVCGEAPPPAPVDLSEQSRLRAARRAIFDSRRFHSPSVQESLCLFSPVDSFYIATSSGAGLRPV
jgi:hypothetical protein